MHKEISRQWKVCLKMFTVGKTRYTKVVHNKYTLCAWQNKLATKTLYRNSAGHVQREKLLFKASSYFLLAHHTCLLGRNSTIAHPKPPTSTEKNKKRQMNIPIRIMSFRRKENKVPDQLRKSTLHSHDRFQYLQGIL